MLLEQVLHIMLNQDYPRSDIISTANIWTFALRCISENGKYGEKVMQTFANAIIINRQQKQYGIYLGHRSPVCLAYEMSSFHLICPFVIANNIQQKSALVKIGAQ